MNTKHTKCKLAYVVPSIRWVTLDNTSLMTGNGSIGLTSVIDFKTLPKVNPSEARVQQNSIWGNSTVDDENDWSPSLEE